MSELTNIEENTEVSEQNTEVTPVETTEVLPKNKYEQIIKWMQEYTPLKNEWVFFNVSVAESGFKGVNSVQNERELERFIDNSRRVEFLFSLNIGEEFDSTTTNNNLDSIQEFENFAKWVETQNKNKNFPTFEDNEIVEKVEVLETVPMISVDSQRSIAKLQGEFKITYLEKGE